MSDFSGFASWACASPDGLAQVFTSKDGKRQVVRTNAGLCEAPTSSGRILEMPADCDVFLQVDSNGRKQLVNGPKGYAFELAGGGFHLTPEGDLVPIHSGEAPLAVENGRTGIMIGRDGSMLVETPELAGSFRFLPEQCFKLGDFERSPGTGNEPSMFTDWDRVRPMHFRVKDRIGAEVGVEDVALWKDRGRPICILEKGAEVSCEGSSDLVRMNVRAGETECFVPSVDGQYVRIAPRSSEAVTLPPREGASGHRMMSHLREAASSPVEAAVEQLIRRDVPSVRTSIHNFPPPRRESDLRQNVQKAIWKLLPRQKGREREL